MLKLSYALFIAWAAVITGGCAADLHRYAFSQVVMGVRADITVYSESEPVAANAVREAFAAMARLDDSLSDYRVDNELARVGRGAHPGPMRVSHIFGTILEQSLAIARATDGAFDPTVGPMVRLWREARKQGTLPEGAKLAGARARSGYENVLLARDDHGDFEVSLAVPGMQLDFGGIGKGAAADEGLRVLRRQGHSRSLVAVAGDIAAGDPPPARDGWTIAVATRSTDTASEFVSIENAAISTSGDSEQFVEIGGVRYSHILDPRTGAGLVGAPIVSVIAPSGAVADALATAICVTGAARAPDLTGRFEGAACLVRDAEAPHRVVYVSAGFPPRTSRP